jgi:hypothetical protein
MGGRAPLAAFDDSSYKSTGTIRAALQMNNRTRVLKTTRKLSQFMDKSGKQPANESPVSENKTICFSKNARLGSGE